jgi:2-oxopent-4-enoate/cis-2-oxohex-4-enoate hydratase
MLKVGQPDFGYLTDKMAFSQGEEILISDRLIQPKAEGEIAFILKKNLMGPSLTAADVLAATDCVIPCFEVVDSRIENWEIKIEDTVADNASCGVFLLGDRAVDPRKVDLATCGMVVEKNGSIISTGAGAAALGSPVNCVIWLANTLGQFGIPLKAGEVILSGSLVPLEPVKAGDFMSVSIGGIGSASVRFI